MLLGLASLSSAQKVHRLEPPEELKLQSQMPSAGRIPFLLSVSSVPSVDWIEHIHLMEGNPFLLKVC